MMIVNQPDIARYIAANGVDRIFVDLESLGKLERQGHRDTLISRHTFDDIIQVRRAVPHAPLLVRLNPWNKGSPSEIDESIERGADMLMLPMFRKHEEVSSFCRCVRSRVPVIPLVETPEAVAEINTIARIDGVREMYIGLNDLHIAMGTRFMFEPLANGLDRVADTLQTVGMPFGFGGIARIGEGLLPAECIVGEHVRLGSSSAILSRLFIDRRARCRGPAVMDFAAAEIAKIRVAEHLFEAGGERALSLNHAEVVPNHCTNYRRKLLEAGVRRGDIRAGPHGARTASGRSRASRETE